MKVQHTPVILLLLAFLPALAHPQGFSIPFRVADTSGHFDTLQFGVHVNATYCIDPALNEFTVSWPPPGTYFLPSFFNPRGLEDSCWGCCYRDLDLRTYYSEKQIDTYRVLLFVGYGYPLTFSWPNLERYYSGSVQLTDLFGGIIINVDMKAETSYVLTNSAFDKLYIIAAGPRIITGVKKSDPLVTIFSLHQNYPNPFNPATKIEFDVPMTSHVTLKVFNVLGQEVKLLKNEMMTPGFKAVEFDGSGLPSGVYYYKLITGNFIAIKKMLLLK